VGVSKRKEEGKKMKSCLMSVISGIVMLIAISGIAIADSPNEEGFIDGWLVCGPFPNLGPTGTEKDHQTKQIYPGWEKDWLIKGGGEAKIEPQEGMSYELDFPASIFWKPGKITVKWEEFIADGNKVNFLEAFSNEKLGIDETKERQVRFVVGYAYCVIDSPEEQKAQIAFGSDDGYKIWLNHQLIGEDASHRGLKIDQDKFPVILKKGKNTLLVKVDQSLGGYGFALRFLSADGSEFIEDIDITY